MKTTFLTVVLAAFASLTALGAHAHTEDRAHRHQRLAARQKHKHDHGMELKTRQHGGLNVSGEVRDLDVGLERRQSSCAPTYTSSVTVNGIGTLPKITTRVTRSGALLKLGGKTFTSVGFNAYWLGLDENPTVAYPSMNRIRELFAIAVAMGANTVRSTTLGVSTGNSLSLQPSAGTFNDQAFATIDYAVYAAKQYGIRLIVPMTDQYQYYHGGKYDFLRFAGASTANNGAAFYTDTKTLTIFKAYIAHWLNHVNAYTGIANKDEPTIMAIETGNELGAYMLNQGAPPKAWTTKIANYIKSVAPNVLVVDGSDGLVAPTDGGLSASNVDIVSDHYYPLSNSLLSKDFNAAKTAKKVFIAGEYDWTQNNGGDSVSAFISAISKDAGAGSLLWSVFGHDSNCCQYVSHNDGYTLQYPTGNTATLQQRILTIVQYWYGVTGRPVPSALPAVACPQPALLT